MENNKINLSQLKINLMTNLGKKDNRLQVLKYEFENLTRNGYTKEEYKDINIFTLDKDGVQLLS